MGVGLTDGWAQTYIRRDLEVLGDIRVEKDGLAITDVTLAGVELPRHLGRDGQLSFELLP
jgi:hypothetical protein